MEDRRFTLKPPSHHLWTEISCNLPRSMFFAGDKQPPQNKVFHGTFDVLFQIKKKCSHDLLASLFCFSGNSCVPLARPGKSFDYYLNSNSSIEELIQVLKNVL